MKQRPPITPVRLNLAPMVDVTMCLLVFFMVATKMVEQENSKIDLPTARAAQVAAKHSLGKRFVVNVINLGTPDRRHVAYKVHEKEISLSEVYARLRAEYRANPNVNCVIRADRSLPYHYVQAVMLGCVRANIHKITFSAIPRAGGCT